MKKYPPVERVEFDDPADVEILFDGKYRLLSPFVATIRFANGSALRVTVPKGFVTDLDTVPRLPFVFLLFKGRARNAAILHDWLVSGIGTDRKFADDVFFAAALAEGVPRWMANMLWLGVRIGSYLGIGGKRSRSA